MNENSKCSHSRTTTTPAQSRQWVIRRCLDCGKTAHEAR